MKFNLNNNVKVKLTQIGRDELKRQHIELYTSLGQPEEPYIPKKEDKEGWSTFQMWSLMNKFGNMIGMGISQPFETVIEIIEIPPTKSLIDRS